jgi:acyl-coenzyme A thioesterase PaaI-like protein
MAGDFVQAYEWTIVQQRSGYLELDVHLPEHLKNQRGHLFGGYTPIYVDLAALRAVHLTRDPADPPMWLTTLGMRVDYLEPISQARFVIAVDVVHRRRGTSRSRFASASTAGACSCSPWSRSGTSRALPALEVPGGRAPPPSLGAGGKAWLYSSR